jgi:hypothetical protein
MHAHNPNMIYDTDTVLPWEHLRTGARAAGMAALALVPPSGDRRNHSSAFTDAWLYHVHRHMPTSWTVNSRTSWGMVRDARIEFDATRVATDAATFTDARMETGISFQLHDSWANYRCRLITAVVCGAIERLSADEFALVDARAREMTTARLYSDRVNDSVNRSWRAFRVILHNVRRRAHTRFDVSGVVREIVRRTGVLDIAKLVGQFVGATSVKVRRPRAERERIASEAAALPIFTGFKRAATADEQPPTKRVKQNEDKPRA